MNNGKQLGVAVKLFATVIDLTMKGNREVNKVCDRLQVFLGGRAIVNSDLDVYARLGIIQIAALSGADRSADSCNALRLVLQGIIDEHKVSKVVPDQLFAVVADLGIVVYPDVGTRFRVQVIGHHEGFDGKTTYRQRRDFLDSQKTVYLGDVGLAMVCSQKAGQLPNSGCLISYDAKDSNNCSAVNLCRRYFGEDSRFPLANGGEWTREGMFLLFTMVP